MKLLCMIICALLLTSTPIYSQKLEKLEELTLQDFTTSNFGSPSIISYKGLITFPYGQNPNNVGAKDQYFTVRIESIARIAVHKRDSSQKIIALSKTFEQGIRFKSIKYYYKNGKSISTRKIDEKELSATSDSIAYYIDCTKIIKDSAAIIDVSFNSESNSKQKIKLYLGRYRLLKEYNLKVYIPEIYFYDIFTTDKCIKTQIEKGFFGPLIGYRSPTGYSGQLLSKALADTFSKIFNTKYEQVFCKTNLFSFSILNPCNDLMKNPNKGIINFNLKNIIEIK
jgi:hypothetical protein